MKIGSYLNKSRIGGLILIIVIIIAFGVGIRLGSDHRLWWSIGTDGPNAWHP